VILPLACTKPVPEESSDSSISVSAGEGIDSVAYQDKDGRTTLALNGVLFELLEPAAYEIDFGALGVSGLDSTSSVETISTKGSRLLESPIWSVLGKDIEIKAGVLFWGADSLGEVAPGDTFVVDAEGVHKKVH